MATPRIPITKPDKNTEWTMWTAWYPTPELEFRDGVLHQNFHRERYGTGDITETQFEWRQVPSQ